MTFNYHDRIQRDPRVAGEQAVTKGTRVTLRTVLASLAERATIDEILEDFLTLTDLDIRAAIAFAAASAQEDPPVAEALSCWKSENYSVRPVSPGDRRGDRGER